jgi:hypothetical protein
MSIPVNKKWSNVVWRLCLQTKPAGFVIFLLRQPDSYRDGTGSDQQHKKKELQVGRPAATIDYPSSATAK